MQPNAISFIQRHIGTVAAGLYLEGPGGAAKKVSRRHAVINILYK